MNTLVPRLALGALLAATTTMASASCGSAFCTLMTDRYAQGTGEPHIGWSADVRIESVSQTRLRSGTTDIGAGQVTGEEAIERRTRNLNLVTTLEYGFDENWSVSVRVPVVRRSHSHDLIDDTTGLPSTPEQWRFTRLGDIQVLARRQALANDAATSYAWLAGLKIPTGSTRVVNGDGSRAERALQPGSGTTDVIVGAAFRRAFGPADALIGQLTIGAALNTREEFRPGARVEASIGWSHAYAHDLGAVLQLNMRRRAHDSGAQAEPSNSSSTVVDLSPGVTIGVGSNATLYGYLQLPVYQQVKGIQLVPRTSVAVGWTADF